VSFLPSVTPRSRPGIAALRREFSHRITRPTSRRVNRPRAWRRTAPCRPGASGLPRHGQEPISRASDGTRRVASRKRINRRSRARPWPKLAVASEPPGHVSSETRSRVSWDDLQRGVLCMYVLLEPSVVSRSASAWLQAALVVCVRRHSDYKHRRIVNFIYITLGPL